MKTQKNACISPEFVEMRGFGPAYCGYCGVLAGEGLWLLRLAVGCLYFNCTSMALQRHFHNTFTTLPRKFNGKKYIYSQDTIGTRPYESTYAGGLSLTENTAAYMGGTSQEGERPKNWEFYPLHIGFS